MGTIPNHRSIRFLLQRLSLAGLLVFLAPVLLAPCLSSATRLFAGSQHEKKDYALIAGTVWGPDDHPVYGIKVTIRRPKDKKPKWALQSDHMGEFAQRVPIGESDYIISADLKGVKTTDGRQLRLVQDVTVHIYHDEREDTGLHLTF